MRAERATHSPRHAGHAGARRGARLQALGGTALTPLLMLLLMLAPGTLRADPMRPFSVPAAASGAAPATAAGAAWAAPAPAPVPERLVAIRHDSLQRWQALLGERWVAVGDRVEGGVVVEIDGNTVSLAARAGGSVRHRLQLLPALVPTPTPSDPSTALTAPAGRKGESAQGTLNP